jgi:hypothetical protein
MGDPARVQMVVRAFGEARVRYRQRRAVDLRRYVEFDDGKDACLPALVGTPRLDYAHVSHQFDVRPTIAALNSENAPPSTALMYAGACVKDANVFSSSKAL